MPIYKTQDIESIAKNLQAGQIGVLPTDTIYGLHGDAFNKEAVEKVYLVKGRDFNKPCIILISNINDLKKFDVELTKSQESLLKTFWPGPVSVVFSVLNPKFSYLHRGTNSLAFRVPDTGFLQEILRLTGPLISTSANVAGEVPAHTIDMAKEYFKDTVAFYVDGGTLTAEPSTLIRFNEAGVAILRQGSAKVFNKS
jgi:L-threonylcarbamoyladenylate synthase